MSAADPCNCPQAIRLALELATERDKLKRIVAAINDMPFEPELADGPYEGECIRQIAEILAEAPGERP